MNQLERRVTDLEQRAGVVGLDVGALDSDDAAFYQGVMRRLARHRKGFESFVRTLADDELERLTEIEIRLTDSMAMDDASRDEWQSVRAEMVEALARRTARHKGAGL